MSTVIYMMSGTQAMFQLEIWGPETETDIYSWIVKMSLTFSWDLENRKTKYNGLMDTGTKEAASSLHLSDDSSPLLSMQTTQFFTLC